MSIHDEIQKSYLVRKKVRHFADQPFYVLGIETVRRSFLSGGVKDENLVEVVIDQVAKLEVLFVFDKKFRNTERKFENISGCMIYQTCFPAGTALLLNGGNGQLLQILRQVTSARRVLTVRAEVFERLLKAHRSGKEIALGALTVQIL